jgi:hypothetical protein
VELHPNKIFTEGVLDPGSAVKRSFTTAADNKNWHTVAQNAVSAKPHLKTPSPAYILSSRSAFIPSFSRRNGVLRYRGCPA